MQNNITNNFKFAIDLGTTTIELALLDTNGAVIATDYFNNPQSLYGKDIINRINTANRNHAFIKTMKDMVIKSISISMDTLLKQNKISHDKVSALCICGNTTMISILLEYKLDELGIYPFSHKLEYSIVKHSKEVFYQDFPIDCYVFLSGCASAFIGGDVLAGLAYIKNEYRPKADEIYLFMDLGTNGELVLYHNYTYYTTSCACGPAFEACNRCTNIYGSSIIDAIALGIKLKHISTDGILNDEYLNSGINIMGINITCELLRDILLAKAAIKTGIDILVKEATIQLDDINYLYVAGGFGFYLNADNASYIGLIPKELRDKYIVLGNSSLKGAIEILKSQDSSNNISIELIDNLIAGDIRLIQMANLPDYQERLINNMYYK